MKKLLIYSSILCVWCTVLIPGHSAVAKTVLSNMVLLPGESPVQVTFPDSDQVIEIRSIRSLPEGAEIAADTQSPFKILCPDLQLLAVSPGDEFDCPKPEVEFLAEVPAPPPIIIEIENNKGPEDPVMLSRDLETKIQRIEQEITQLSLEEQDKWYLLSQLYTTQGAYQSAIALLESQGDALTEPALLFLLGKLYLKTGNEGFRKAVRTFYRAFARAEEIQDIEAQAVAQHYLAVLLNAFESHEEAEQRAREALRLYQELGYSKQIELMQRILETP